MRSPGFENALELAGWVWTLPCFEKITMDGDCATELAAAVERYAQRPSSEPASEQALREALTAADEQGVNILGDRIAGEASGDDACDCEPGIPRCCRCACYGAAEMMLTAALGQERVCDSSSEQALREAYSLIEQIRMTIGPKVCSCPKDCGLGSEVSAVLEDINAFQAALGQERCGVCGGQPGIGSNEGEWFDKDCPACQGERKGERDE